MVGGVFVESLPWCLLLEVVFPASFADAYQRLFISSAGTLLGNGHCGWIQSVLGLCEAVNVTETSPFAVLSCVLPGYCLISFYFFLNRFILLCLLLADLFQDIHGKKVSEDVCVDFMGYAR